MVWREERANGEIYGEPIFSPSDDNSNEFGSSDEFKRVENSFDTPSPTKKDTEFSSPIQMSQFLDPQTPHLSPSKSPATPISVVQPSKSGQSLDFC